MKKILVVHAHPDDTEAFTAGTLLLLAQRDFTITIVTTTTGGLGGINPSIHENAEIRRKEAEKAAGLIGAEYRSLGYNDGFLLDSAEARIKVAREIRRVKPDVVITHLPMDYHSDHRLTAQLTEIGCMLSTLPALEIDTPPTVKTPLLYHSQPMRLRDQLGNSIFTSLEQGFVVNITEVIDDKDKILGCHLSQIALMKLMHGMDDFFEEMRSVSAEAGGYAGYEFGEIFFQHTGAGFSEDPLLQRSLQDHITDITDYREE